jgi:ParB-like chromosome segregation protein Spo0J
MTMTSNLQGENVDIASLESFPNNPRIGDLGTIKESLRRLGQYRPIVVHKATRRVLAGHHVWQAAKDLGWETIAVTWVDGDETFCKKVVLADNRTADLGSYQNAVLTDLLRSLPDLIATGYDAIPRTLDKELAFTKPAPRETKPRKKVICGSLNYKVDHLAWEIWHDQIFEECGGQKIKIPRQIGSRLGIELTTKAKNRKLKFSNEATMAIIETQELPIDSVEPFYRNAREGDIGAICESLSTLGQFRPIVVNRRTREILVGNHTWAAAKALKWKTIAVSWVDVDEETATRIVLVDNRSTDLATYDEALLRQTMVNIDLQGTGWDLEEMNDLFSGMETRPKATKRIKLKVGQYLVPVESEALLEWIDKLPEGKEIEHIADLLLLPISELPN